MSTGSGANMCMALWDWNRNAAPCSTPDMIWDSTVSTTVVLHERHAIWNQRHWIPCSTACSSYHQEKHLCAALLVLCGGIHRVPVDSLRTWPIMQKAFPCHDVIILINIAVAANIMAPSEDCDIRNHRAYRQTSNISRSKSQKLNISHIVLQPNPLKPCVKSRMKM